MEQNSDTKGNVYTIENEICNLLQKKSPKGMELLFDEYFTNLVTWANLFLNDLNYSKDIVQEVYVEIWEKSLYKKFRPESLLPFLKLLVRHKSLNSNRKKDIFKQYIELDKVEAIWDEYNESKEQVIHIVLNEISHLPPRSQEIMKMVFVDGMKYRQVAENLDISESTVKTLISKSLEKVRSTLNNDEFFNILLYMFFSEEND